MNEFDFSFTRDILLPLALVAVILFMPFRMIQAVLIFFVATRAVALLMAWLGMHQTSARRVDTVVYSTARAPFRIRYEVTNRWIVPTGPVLVTDSAGNFATNRHPSDLCVVGSGERVRLEYVARGQQRGEHRVGPVTIAGADPLGFYEWERRVEAYIDVIIYPAVHRVFCQERDGLPAGNLTVKNPLYEDPTQFQSLREYSPGDEIKRVNWKASARMGTLYSMDYVPSIYFPVMVALNLTASSYPLNGRTITAERAIETAASLIFFYVGMKQEVGMTTTGETPAVSDAGDDEGGRSRDGAAAPEAESLGTYTPIRPGRGYAVTMLEELARIKLSDAGADLTVLLQRASLPAGTRLLVISPPLSAGQADRLMALKRRGYRIRCFVVGSRSTNREQLSVPGIESVAVLGREDELVRE